MSRAGARDGVRGGAVPSAPGGAGGRSRATGDPPRTTSIRGGTSSRGTSAGQYAYASCTSGRPPNTPSPGGAWSASPSIVCAKRSTFFRSGSRTAARKTPSFGSTSGAAAPQQLRSPVREVRADAVPEHLGETIRLGADVGSGDEGEPDRAPAVAVDDRHLE